MIKAVYPPGCLPWLYTPGYTTCYTPLGIPPVMHLLVYFPVCIASLVYLSVCIASRVYLSGTVLHPGIPLGYCSTPGYTSLCVCLPVCITLCTCLPVSLSDIKDGKRRPRVQEREGGRGNVAQSAPPPLCTFINIMTERGSQTGPEREEERRR